MEEPQETTMLTGLSTCQQWNAKFIRWRHERQQMYPTPGSGSCSMILEQNWIINMNTKVVDEIGRERMSAIVTESGWSHTVKNKSHLQSSTVALDCTKSMCSQCEVTESKRSYIVVRVNIILSCQFTSIWTCLIHNYAKDFRGCFWGQV